MFHKFFYPIPIVAAGDVTYKAGAFSVDGGYMHRIGANNTEELYLFDSTARTAVGNADFVIVSVIAGGDNADTLNTTVCHAMFDTQGDGGSGSMLSINNSTTTAKNVVWCLSSINKDAQEDSTLSGEFGTMGASLIVPASLFGTSDTTRTGRIIGWSGSATVDPLVLFQFCSWNTTITSQYRPGNFTIRGCHLASQSTSQTNYLFNSSLRAEVSSTDFVLATQTNGNSPVQSLAVDFQGDGGSGSQIASGTGTSTAKNVLWRMTQGNHYHLPPSLPGSSDTTRTGRRLSNFNSGRISYILCNWGA